EARPGDRNVPSGDSGQRQLPPGPRGAGATRSLRADAPVASGAPGRPRGSGQPYRAGRAIDDHDGGAGARDGVADGIVDGGPQATYDLAGRGSALERDVDPAARGDATRRAQGVRDVELVALVDGAEVHEESVD